MNYLDPFQWLPFPPSPPIPQAFPRFFFFVSFICLSFSFFLLPPFPFLFPWAVIGRGECYTLVLFIFLLHRRQHIPLDSSKRMLS